MKWIGTLRKRWEDDDERWWVVMWQWIRVLERQVGRHVAFSSRLAPDFCVLEMIPLVLYILPYVYTTHIYIPNCRKPRKVSVLQKSIGRKKERGSQFRTNSHSLSHYILVDATTKASGAVSVTYLDRTPILGGGGFAPITRSKFWPTKRCWCMVLCLVTLRSWSYTVLCLFVMYLIFILFYQQRSISLLDIIGHWHLTSWRKNLHQN